MTTDELIGATQYSLASAAKHTILTDRLRELTERHRERCEPYGRILHALGVSDAPIRGLADVPTLPIGLFKSHVLRSIPESAVTKVVTSSGTTGAAVSRIYLDAAAARLQTRTLASIMTHWLGKARMPMLIVDARSTVQDRRTYSARGAGIVGMSTFGRDHCYALDADMQLDREAVTAWCARHAGEPVLVFGFTFMIWQHLLEALVPGELDLSGAILIHAGGWKKLVERAVGDAEFKARLAQRCGLQRVHNFYGMAEQIGTVFVQCAQGRLHAPNTAEVIVRDPHTWEPVGHGQEGVAQMLSALPESYPGHSILTEDLARIEGVDDCPCGRLGTTVSILGRVPEAELRGCSDTHAHNLAAA